MYSERRTRVVTKEPVGEKSVKLQDVFDEQRWRDAVDASPMAGCYLTEMCFDEFKEESNACVLSYRWENEMDISCGVSDPVGKVKEIEGRVNCSFLLTPPLDWTHLWVDFLSHLFEPEGWGNVRETVGQVYWHATVVPLYFLVDRPDAHDKAEEALTRGWIRAELSLGRLHREGVLGAIRIGAEMLRDQYPYQTYFKGLPHKHRGCRFLRSFCECRPHLCDGYESLDGKNNRLYRDGWDTVWQTCQWYQHVITEFKMKFVPVPSLTTPDETTLAWKKKNLEAFLETACQRQLPDDPVEVLEEIEPKCVFHVFCASGYWDKGDMYTAPVAVYNAALGLPTLDPLKEFRLRHAADPDAARNDNGSPKFAWNDLDVAALNGNYKILRRLWMKVLAEDEKAAMYHDHHHVEIDRDERAPGTSTLGLGPLAHDELPEGGVFKVGSLAAIRFKESGSKVVLGNIQWFEKSEPTIPQPLLGREFNADSLGPNFI